MNLPVPMSSTVPWTLNKMHVKVAFRMCVSVRLYTDSVNYQIIKYKYQKSCLVFELYFYAISTFFMLIFVYFLLHSLIDNVNYVAWLHDIFVILKVAPVISELCF